METGCDRQGFSEASLARRHGGGEKNVSAINLKKIAETLGLSLRDLFDQVG